MAKPSATRTDTSAGVAAYSSIFLRLLYDYLVLGLYCRFAWRCPTHPTLTTFFNSHVPTTTTSSSTDRRQLRMLDIGVGTGYFLEQAPLSAAGISDVVLVDLNANCLARTAPRVQAAHPHVNCIPVQADFYRLDDSRLLAASPTPSSSSSPSDDHGGDAHHHHRGFDAISAMLLLHCLPGPPARKAAALCGLRTLMDAERGVLFGATVLGDGVGHNVLGRLLMRWHNAVGIFDNKGDEATGFVEPLREAFKDVEWRVEGKMLLFEARGPIL
ncbi:methyltransferase domain-containing protein [Diplodia corticola]|uniref:Methyltransferase domain-containing protein n=1 Tax=Diplodia corticola TaxID=236234 RepID=A0A1J9RIM1_9PEZI|nr:methyltransferase domain-containing protein [Diplodia corticola]OJD40313.1 methyltransferase domain-containing protein [Diplodia corticola]